MVKSNLAKEHSNRGGGKPFLKESAHEIGLVQEQEAALNHSTNGLAVLLVHCLSKVTSTVPNGQPDTSPSNVAP